MHATKRPLDVLIDTDNGLGTLGADPEDGLAILLALTSPEIEIRAITTVFGNCHLDSVNANTSTLLRLAGRSDIPLAAGFDRPLMADHPAGHPSPARREDAQILTLNGSVRQGAIELIVETARAAADGLTIVALGPLTNVGATLRLHRPLVDQVRELVIMGGGARESNVTPLAEFNIWADPVAAHLSLNAHVPTRMIGLDVCHRVRLTSEDLAELDGGGPLATLAQRCFGSLWWSPVHLYDTLTVASVIEPDLLRYVPARVVVEYEHGPGFGQTSVLWRNGSEELGFAVDVEVERFKQLFRTRVLRALRDVAGDGSMGKGGDVT